MRGQNNEAWLARWRDGACPVHGRGFLDDDDEVADPVGADVARALKCSILECTVRVARWPGADDHHASLGGRAGPEEIRALLVKAGDVDGDSARPGKRARVVRTSYRLE